MLTLSYGYKLPENTDTGDAFFPAMEFNIQRLNNHTHDGVNSAPLTSVTINIPSGSWVASGAGDGLYQQDINIPSPYTYDASQIGFKLSNGEPVYPAVTRLTNNSMRVYTNDNTQTYVAYLR